MTDISKIRIKGIDHDISGNGSGSSDVTREEFDNLTNTVNDEVNARNQLIKSDGQGNVLVNVGYVEAYEKAQSFDPNKTYYEAYIPIDTNKLIGTWKSISYDKPSAMYSFSKGFTEGNVLTSNTWHPTVNAPFEKYVTSINSNGNCYFKSYDGTDAGYGPMFIGTDWNSCGLLSFKTEIDDATLQFVKAFYNKMTDRVIEEEGNNTIAKLQELDRQHPSYRVIELTAETFIPDTYYTKTTTPTWVDIKTLMN